MKERDLSEPVCAWLRRRGFAVYTEVPFYDSALDIVGVRRGSVEAVELKLCLTEKVKQQAGRASLGANRAWIAIASSPRRLPDVHPRFARIGILRVMGGRVQILRRAGRDEQKLLRGVERMRERLAQTPEGGVGGVACELGVGPAQTVYAAVQRHLAKHPCATWKEMFEVIPNHYISAKSMCGAMKMVEERRAWRERRNEK